MIGRARSISIGLAILLAAVLLYFSLRGIDWHEVWRLVSHARPDWLVLSASLATLALFLRAFRWRVLLLAAGPVSVADAFWATAAGFFGNNFLPARAGEIVRTVMVAGSSRLERAFVLATALSERVVDAVVLVAISALVILAMPAQPGWLTGAARSMAVVGLAGVAIIAVLPFMEGVALTMTRRMPMPAGLRPRVDAAVGHGLEGIRTFHDPSRLGVFLALTAVIWSLDAMGTVLASAALGLTMPVGAAFLLIAALGLASALPSTPGYVGIYQFVAVTVLVPFGFSRTDAIAYILVAQALMYVVVGLWGSIGLLRTRRVRSK